MSTKLLAAILPVALLFAAPWAPVRADDWSFTLSQSNQGSYAYSGQGVQAQEAWGSANTLSVGYQNGQVYASQAEAAYRQGSMQTPYGQSSWSAAAYDQRSFSSGPNGTSYQYAAGSAATSQGSYATPQGQRSWSRSRSASRTAAYNYGPGGYSYSGSSNSSDSYSYSGSWNQP